MSARLAAWKPISTTTNATQKSLVLAQNFLKLVMRLKLLDAVLFQLAPTSSRMGASLVIMTRKLCIETRHNNGTRLTSTRQRRCVWFRREYYEKYRLHHAM
jgi:hypothetical protein